MDRRLRIGLETVLVLIIIAGAAVLLSQQIRWRESAAAQERAVQTVHFTPPSLTLEAAPFDPERDPEEPDPVAEELAALDLAPLREINEEVAGWLYVPGTEISYPILQAADNDYYLKHTWEKKWNGGGSIFLDYRCSGDFTDFNTILYGHRMNNGTMFAPLRAYTDQDFWRDHPYVYVADGARVYRYEIFAAWEAGVTSIVYAVDGDRQRLLDSFLGASQIDTGLVPGTEDTLLTLSTCTGNGHATRWVVQAVLAQVYEGTETP